MGIGAGKNAKLSNQQVQVYSQQTQLQPYVIQQIYEAFIDRAGKNGRMTINEFKLAYPQINPNINLYTIDLDAERVFMMFDADRNGVLTFDEFLMAFIQMQRGSNNPSNHWQYLKNIIPPGILSRLNLLISTTDLFQTIKHSSKSDLIQQHSTQLILQLIQEDYLLQFFFTYSYILLTYFLSFLFLLYISLINKNNFNQIQYYFHRHHYLVVVEIVLHQD